MKIGAESKCCVLLYNNIYWYWDSLPENSHAKLLIRPKFSLAAKLRSSEWALAPTEMLWRNRRLCYALSDAQRSCFALGLNENDGIKKRIVVRHCGCLSTEMRMKSCGMKMKVFLAGRCVIKCVSKFHCWMHTRCDGNTIQPVQTGSRTYYTRYAVLFIFLPDALM